MHYFAPAMDRFLFFMALLLGLAATAPAQGGLGFEVLLEERQVPGMPALQSFAWGRHAGQWLLIGGRLDGLHRRQPFAAFDTLSANRSLYLVDPTTNQVWHTSTVSLPTPLREQLSSANFEYLQVDTTLYVIGGYAYAHSVGDHVTHAQLSALHLPSLCAAIRAGQPIAPHIRTLVDERLRLTGGQLGLLDGRFLLVGGHKFMGAYNPAGPDFGDGFVQAYSNAIRSFRLLDEGGQLRIADYREVVDTMRLHRRDFNLVPQLFPGDSLGYTAFSGVFQHDDRIPWLDAVDLHDGDGFRIVPDFEQLLQQYHCARLSGYDSRTGKTHTLFFGGIGRYYFNDEDGGLVDDINVPFVKTISRVTRGPDGRLSEYDTEMRMPGYLGAAAEFIPAEGLPQLMPLLLDLSAIHGRTRVGSIVGGIEANLDNFFFENEGEQSRASTRIFDVILIPITPSPRLTTCEVSFAGQASYDPGRRAVLLDACLPADGSYMVTALDDQGRRITEREMAGKAGPQTWVIPTGGLPSGKYLFQLRFGSEGLVCPLEIP